MAGLSIDTEGFDESDGLYGSGGGSIPHSAIFDAFPKVWALAAGGKLRIDTETVPLADVESAWQRRDMPGRRLVFILWATTRHLLVGREREPGCEVFLGRQRMPRPLRR